MSPEQLDLQLMETSYAFVPIMVKPSHDNVVRIHEALTSLLLQGGYDKAHAKHNIRGIIAPTDACAENYGDPFATPECIGDYPPILQDAIDQNLKLDSVWKIHIKDYAFILTVVDNVWVSELHNPTMFYTDILPSALLTHPEVICSGLYAIDAYNLLFIIQGHYTDASSIPVYVNMLEDAQRKLLRTELPLSDVTLLDTTTKAVLAS